jgi:hypothetical protein
MIPYPQEVETLIAQIGWFTLGEMSVIKYLCTQFPKLKRVYLQGRKSIGVLYGFGDEALELMASHFHELTHLFLDGFGRSSFTFDSLSMLCMANPNLRVLSVGHVGYGIDLDRLAKAAPNLQVLTVQFKTSNDRNSCLPSLTGSLSSFAHLEKVFFYDDYLSSECDSLAVVARLKNTCRTETRVFVNKFIE